jgi:hypothetical protein
MQKLIVGCKRELTSRVRDEGSWSDALLLGIGGVAEARVRFSLAKENILLRS